MYKVNISDILREVGKKKVIDEMVPLQEEDDLFKINCTAHAELTAENVGELILVNGKCTATVELNCVRCNGPVQQKIEVADIEQEYYLEDKMLHFNEEDKKIGLDEFRFVIDERGNIDIEDLLKQEVILALPIKPICNNCHNEVSYSTGENK